MVLGVQEQRNYEKKVMVGCCNFTTIWGDKAANLKKIATMIGTAAEIGVNIVAFPELALTGYECESESGCGKGGMHKKLAETIPGPSTEEIAKLAKERDIYVILGMPERDRTSPDKIYISAVLIGPEGIIGAYRKLHLGPSTADLSEQLCFTGGAQVMKEIPVFETRYGPVGITICYDFWRFPEITRIQVMKGARLLFNCTASGAAPGGEPQLHMYLVTGARSMENGVFAASANLAGKDRTKLFYGHSTIAGPAFPRVVRIYAEGGMGEEIVSATLSFDQLFRGYKRMPFLEDRKIYSSELILQELQKLSSTG